MLTWPAYLLSLDLWNRARVLVFDIDLPLTKGFHALFHYQQWSQPVVITKLISVLNKTTGELLQKKPRCLTKNATAIIELTFPVDRPMCVETAGACKVGKKMKS